MDGSEHSAPRIGVTWVTAGDPVSERYMEAVRRAGGRAVPLPQEADSWDGLLDGLDGLMLTGGVDVDPALYGDERLPECQPPNPRRDRLEVRALDLALSRGLPVLGICRGFQLLNVYLGGKLIQDILTRMPGALTHHRLDGERSSFHAVRIYSDSRLRLIVPSGGLVLVNSRHHQGVAAEQVAPTLRISAVAEDGIVEGLESADGRFVLGVQCHPERPGEATAMEPVFGALVEACGRGA